MNKTAARWSLVALVLVVGMIYALWPRQNDTDVQAATTSGQGSSGQGSQSQTQDRSIASGFDDALTPLRATAQLDACPTANDATPASTEGGPLAGLVLECLADGSEIDVGAALAGRPALINIWAYWCGPCADELPHIQEYAQRAAGSVGVLTVHQNLSEYNALSALAEYGVRLPGVEDGYGKVAAAVGAPSVLPVTVLLDANGTVVKVLPQTFHSVDEIAEAVRVNLGVVS